VEYPVQGAFHLEGPGHVRLEEVKTRMGQEAVQVPSLPRGEVVHPDDLAPLLKKPLRQMAPQEARSAREKDPHHTPTLSRVPKAGTPIPR
jgi:hypothetical protein